MESTILNSLASMPEKIDKDAFIEREIIVSSRGRTEIQRLGNIDSAGQIISNTQKGLESFWDSFADTEALDEQGRPIRLYHATNSDIAEFETSRKTVNTYSFFGEVETTRAGIFMSDDPTFAEEYLSDREGQNMMPVYLRIENPLVLKNGITESLEHDLEEAGINVRYVLNIQNDWSLFDNDEDGKNEFVDLLKKAGYDGAIYEEERPSGEEGMGTVYVAFDSTQIKSAIGNDGSYDPKNPDIRYKLSDTKSGVKAESVTLWLARIRKHWKNAPPIHIVQSVARIPVSLNASAAGAYSGGEVYLIADNIADRNHAEFVLLHEVIGHHGLTHILGDRLDHTMLNIYHTNEEIKDRADKWLSSNNSADIALATEEVLSDQVAQIKSLSSWDRLYSGIRRGLRSIGFKIRMSNLDISVLLHDSRRWIEQGTHVSTVASLKTRFSLISKSATSGFKNWFGNSKVVNKNNQPLTLYRAISGEWDDEKAKNANLIWASSSPDGMEDYVDDLPTLYPLNMSIQHPADLRNDQDAIDIIETQGLSADDLYDITESKEIKENLMLAGYDGIIAYHYGLNQVHYAAFSADQIRLTMDNTFDLNVKQKEFDTWIEGSKVTDPSGIPLRVYTGSSHDIKDFRTDVGTGKSHGTGVFFNSSPAVASTYTGGINGGNITPAYLSLKSPVQLDAKGANWNRLTKSTKISLPALEVNDKADQDLLAELLGEPISKVTTTIRKARNTTLGKLFPDEFLFDDFFSTDDIARWARKEGYEGVIFENVIDRGPTGSLATEEAEKPHTVYVCFQTDQIRNAISYNDCLPKIIREENMNNQMVFHGTPNGVFEKFDTTPIYFTESREVAEGYATGSYSRDESDWSFPVLVSAQLDLKNPKTYTEAELIELTSDDNEIDWSNLDSVIYELQDQGFDSMIITGAYDYMGGNGDDVKRGRYNQYVAFDTKQVKIIDQVDILGISPKSSRTKSKHDHSSSLEI